MRCPRHLRRAWLPALVCLLGASLVVPAAPVAALSIGDVDETTPSATETDTPAEEADEPEEPAQLVVAPAAPVFDPGENSYVFTVLLRNPGSEPLAPGAVELELSLDPAADMEALMEPSTVPGVVIASESVGETPPGEEQSITLSIPGAQMPLDESSERGVYRAQATLEPEESDATAPAEDESAVPGDTLQGLTPMVWRGAELGSRVQLTTVVPLVLPEEVRSLPTRGQLDAAVPRLDALLTAAEQAQSTLAVDPRLIAGIRAYGDAAPNAAVEWLERLRTTELPQFTLQFADADPAAQAALGFDELLQPAELDFVTRFGTFPTPELDTPTPGTPDEPETGTGSELDANASGDEVAPSDATAEGTDAGQDPSELDLTASGVPALADLLDWPVADANTAWPAGGEVDSATMELLRNSGVSSIVLESGNTNATGGPLAQIDDMDAVIADTALGLAIRDGIGAPTAAERSAGIASAAAQLALAAQEDHPGLVIALDRGAIAEAEDPERVLDELAQLRWVDEIAQDEQAEGSGSLRAGSTLEDRRELLRTASARESTVNGLAPLLTRPEYLIGYQRARLMQLFSTRYAPESAGFAGVAERFQARDSELLDGVRVISTEQTQLVGTSSRVPLQLRNALPFEAAVTGEVLPASAALRVTETAIERTVVPAEGNETVLVPVHSRVSSGDSGLIVSLTDVSGEHTYFTGTLPIMISSAVEGIALWSLGALALLLLGFGTWRSLRRRSAVSRP